MDILAIITLIAYAIVIGALIGNGKETKGFHVLLPQLLSIALCVVVLVS